MTKQMTKVAMMMVLAMGLMVDAATAQKNDDGGFAPVGVYTGIEMADGTFEPGSGMIFGNTFVLTSYGEWETHQLTISLDYHVGIIANSYIVSGGSWSLVVTRDNKFDGALYGQVENGLIVIGTDRRGEEISKQVNVRLATKQALGIFEGKGGKAMTGVYNAITDMTSRERSTNGSLSMPF